MNNEHTQTQRRHNLYMQYSIERDNNLSDILIFLFIN